MDPTTSRAPDREDRAAPAAVIDPPAAEGASLLIVPDAGAGDRWGIKVVADGAGRCAIDVPPLGWASALRALRPAAVCTAVCGIVAAAMAAGLGTQTRLDVALVLVSFLAAAISSAWGLATAARRTSDRTIIEVTADELVVRERNGDYANGWREQRWPRALVAEIKPDLPRTGMMIRIIGKARLELLQDHPPEARHWVAERLRGALGRASP